MTLTGLETDLSILLRIVIGAVLGGAIGWERETIGKAAGLRTHMLVCAAAALFVALGNLVVASFRVDELVRADPLRVIEAIVAGVSFLGAGTIFVSRGERQVVGLTTAASIWITAAIGIAIGIERYVLALGCTVIVLLILRLLPRLGLDVNPRQ